MIWTDDPVRDYDRYYADQERRAEALPVCEGCGNRIYDDYYWQFGDEVFCENCAKRLFRKITPEV